MNSFSLQRTPLKHVRTFHVDQKTSYSREFNPLVWYLRLSFLKVASHFIIYEGWYILVRTLAFAPLELLYTAVVYPNRRRIRRMKKSRLNPVHVSNLLSLFIYACSYFTPSYNDFHRCFCRPVKLSTLLQYLFPCLHFVWCVRTICEFETVWGWI